MAEIYAPDVKLELGAPVLAKLILIEDSGRRVARRCESDLAAELTEFRNQLAAHLAETRQEELQDTEKRTYFNNRLLNTYDFFRLSPPILDTLVNSVNLRKRAVESMAQSMADFFLEIAFMGLEFLRGKKVVPGPRAVTKEIAEKGIREIEEKNVKAAISSFMEKVSKLYAENSQAFAKLTEELRALKGKIGRIIYKIERMKEWALERKKLEKTVPDVHFAELWRKTQDVAQLEMEVMKRDQALISKKAAADALEQVRDKLASLAAETGENLSDKWTRLFGPDGEGGKLIEEARRECQEKLELMASVKSHSIERLKEVLPDLPDHMQTGLARVFAAMEESVEWMKKLDVFDKIWFDTQKNYTSQTWANAMNQAQSADEQQKAQLGTGSRWETLWSWWYTIRDLAHQLVIHTFGVFTGLVSVVISVGVTALGWIGALAMWVFGAVAGFVERLDSFSGTTFLGAGCRQSGKAIAVKSGLTGDFFTGAGQKQAIQAAMGNVDPDNLPDSLSAPDKGVRQGFKGQAGSSLKEHAVREQGQQKKEIYGIVIQQCRWALAPRRITEIMPDFTRAQSASSTGAVKHIIERMTEYNKQFEFGDSGFFEFVKNMAWGDVELKFSWEELGNYLQLIGSQITLLARIVYGVPIFTVVGAPFVPGILGAAEVMDLVTAGGRVFTGIVCTMPSVNAFAYDLVAVHSLAYDSLIEGNKALPEPELAGWGCQASG